MVRPTDTFSIAFARSPLALTITSLKTGRVIDVNDGFVRVSGYSRDEAVGRTPDELGLWIEPDIRSERFEKLRAGEPVPDIEARFHLKDGSELIGVIGSAIVEIDGEPCVLSSVLDITERKRVEQALLEHEQRYRAIVESQTEMVCRFRRDGTILFANAAYARARATTPAALVGANFWAFVPDSDHDAVAALLDSLSPDAPEARVENRFEAADGVRWTLWTNRALTFDSVRQPVEFQSSGLDITERRRAEEALRESENRYRHMFESAGTSIWDEDFSDVKRALVQLSEGGVTDFAAYFREHPQWIDDAVKLVRVREVNPATVRMFGATSAAQLLESLEHVFLPETRRLFRDELVAIAEGRRTLEAETRMRTLDGRRIDVMFTIAFPPPTGRFDSVLVTVTDITDRKRMEREARAREAHFREMAEALQQSARVKDEFLATLSHELRTPLNAVLGWAHLLNTGALAPDVMKRALQSLERNARAQSHLIDDLLDMSRIVSGRLQIASDAVDAWSVINAAVDTVRPTAAVKGVELHVSGEQGANICVRGDSDRLRQILWNLLANAIKFTPTGGRVQVEFRAEPSYAEITVLDSGEGIDAEFLPHVFERFRQADSSSTRRHGGLGLGLSIARHLTEAHGGTIAVHSEGRDRGATFTVRLPREVTRDANAPPATAVNSGARRRLNESMR